MQNRSPISTFHALTIAIVRGLAFSLITLIYLGIQTPLTPYLWVVYTGFFLSTALGCGRHRFFSYLCSLGCGFLWGILYLHMSGWITSLLPVSMLAAAVFSEFFLTTSLLFIHLKFLKGTLLGTIPAVFAAIAVLFSSGSLSAIPWCAISAGTGICMAFLTELVIQWILRMHDHLTTPRLP